MIKELKALICKNGGFVNCHAHLDRAYTFKKEDFLFSKNHLFEKWKFVDKIKSLSSEEDYYNRICKALEHQKAFGVQAVLSFIDIDEVAGYRALNAAVRAKESVSGIKLKIACQTLKGVVGSKQRSLIENRMDDIDIIGGLPGVENPHAHMDIIFSWAKSARKRVHVHVDQLNSSDEKETELLINYAKEYKVYDKATAVHSISLAAQNKQYRDLIYSKAKDVGLSFVSCPSAWIDSPRKETLQVFHNAVTPADEIINKNILLGIGSDNINDIYKPYSDGNMMTELRFLLESNKIYDIDSLVKISVDNGLKIIGET